MECEKVGRAREKRLLEFTLEGGMEEELEEEEEEEEEEDQPIDCG